MNKESMTLIIDAVINYALGMLCILYPFVANTLGVPLVENAFYPNVLGAVLFGIGIALTIECRRKRGQSVGLGLAGAVAINLSGGVMLALWLVPSILCR